MSDGTTTGEDAGGGGRLDLRDDRRAAALWWGFGRLGVIQAGEISRCRPTSLKFWPPRAPLFLLFFQRSRFSLSLADTGTHLTS